MANPQRVRAMMAPPAPRRWGPEVEQTLEHLRHCVEQSRYWARRAEQLEIECERAMDRYVQDQATELNRTLPTTPEDAAIMWDKSHYGIAYAAKMTWAYRRWRAYTAAVLAEQAWLQQLGWRPDGP